jgi:hypothetical protein
MAFLGCLGFLGFLWKRVLNLLLPPRKPQNTRAVLVVYTGCYVLYAYMQYSLDPRNPADSE